MNYGRIVSALASACVLACACAPALSGQSTLGDDPGHRARVAPSDLRAIAAAFDRAASARKMPTSRLVRLPPALHSWLVAGLVTARKEKSARARAADLRAMAVALRTAASLARGPAAAGPKSLQTDVRLVLAEPAFLSTVKPSPSVKEKPSWLASVWISFLKWWGSLLARAFTSAASTPLIGNIAAIVLITAAALALTFLVVRGATLVAARRFRGGELGNAGTPVVEHANADETYDTACTAAHNGAYGAAIALLFQAALLALDRSGCVPYDSARTAGEYRRAVRRSAASAVNSFETLARAFTSVAYAQLPAGQGEWQAANAAFASMSLRSDERP